MHAPASVDLTAFKSCLSQPYPLGIPRPSGRLRLREGGRLPSGTQPVWENEHQSLASRTPPWSALSPESLCLGKSHRWGREQVSGDGAGQALLAFLLPGLEPLSPEVFGDSEDWKMRSQMEVVWP